MPSMHLATYRATRDAKTAPSDELLRRHSTYAFDTWSLLVILGVACYYVYLAVAGVVTWRAAGLPAVLVEIATWCASALIVATRGSGLRLRISDPGVIFLGWCLFFYVDPGVSWVTGEIRYEPAFESIVGTAQFVHVQYVQAIFIAALVIPYRLIAPPMIFSADSCERILDSLPPVRWLVVIGVAPVVAEAVRRFIETGSIVPTGAYIDMWYGMREEARLAANSGGVALLLDQLEGKLAIVPLVALGAALGMVFAKLVRERRWRTFLLLHLAFPLLTYMGVGARSNALSTFIVAVAIADLLAGPVPWSYVFGVVSVGGVFAQAYALFRMVQNESLEAALATVSGEYGKELYTENEGSGMIVKESFIVTLVDRSGVTQGARYFVEQVASLLPQQMLPDKMGWMRMAQFLSNELLGREASRGAGIAGAMVADGYWMGRDVGVAILAAVLGVLVGVVVRWCVRGRVEGGVALWWVVLLAGFCSRLFFVIRGDLGIVLTEIVVDVAAPAFVISLLTARYPGTRWSAILHRVGGDKT